MALAAVALVSVLHIITTTIRPAMHASPSKAVVLRCPTVGPHCDAPVREASVSSEQGHCSGSSSSRSGGDSRRGIGLKRAVEAAIAAAAAEGNGKS